MRAESGEHTTPEWIRSLAEYETIRVNKRALELLVNNLEYCTNSLLKEYCKHVKHGDADVMKLLVRQELLRSTDFYNKELAIITDMLHEYEAYLRDGNIIRAFFFNDYRPDSELWDRRDMSNGF